MSRSSLNTAPDMNTVPDKSTAPDRSTALTRRAALTGLMGLGMGFGLSGCMGVLAGSESGLEATAISSQVSRSPLMDEPSLLVATTRKLAGDGMSAPFLTGDRGKGLMFARASLAPPSQANIASRIASGETSSWSVKGLSRVVSGGAGQALAQAASGRDVLLYVHGYNETFETAAKGAANLSDGIKFQGQSALFTWPSGGGLIAYAYDRESALWSRDAFLEMLKALGANPSVGRVHIVVHSMGAFLTLEALRQLRSGASDPALAKIGALVLASPDVDIDQFESTVGGLGQMARRITVISATNDRALAVSSRLAGGISRAGSSERARLEALGVRVADASDFGSFGVRHDLFLTSEDVRAVIARAIARES